jgi:hypothetical protein
MISTHKGNTSNIRLDMTCGTQTAVCIILLDVSFFPEFLQTYQIQKKMK